MSLVKREHLDIQLGEYRVGGSGALADPLLVGRAQDYRRQAAARMIPLEADDVPKRFAAGDYHVSLKIDGEFDLLVVADGEAITVNPGGTVRYGLPWMREAADRLKKAGIRRAIIAGELYYAKSEGTRSRVHDVSRVARQPASQAELDLLAFAPFDIVEIDGAAPPSDFAAVWKRLEKIFGGARRCAPPESAWLSDGGQIAARWREWVGQGAEGAVVRSDAFGQFKVKPRHTLDAVVIGFTEGTDDRRGMIHDLLLAMMRPDGCLQVVGRVGGGFSNADRQNFLSDLKDTVVESEYVEVNDQVAYHMVRPELVIEISVLDVIAQTTRGQPITRMVLHWNADKGWLQVVRRMPLAAFISPQFLRRREDKRVNRDDIRVQQIADIVEVSLLDRDARQFSLPPSEVLRRDVRTKVLKGETLVRKLIMLKTNKEKASDEHPAYVIHATDFSPGRKTPLEREIRVSSSREQIDRLWEELAAETFTKGWVAAAAPTATAPKAEPAAPLEAEPSAAVKKSAAKSRAKKSAEPPTDVAPAEPKPRGRKKKD